MNKEDVLKKSREENKGVPDEGEMNIILHATRIGMVVGGTLAIIIAMFARIIDEPLLGLSAWAIYFSMLGSNYAYQFVKTKKKIKLWQAIVSVVFGLACFVGMIILGLKK